MHAIPLRERESAVPSRKQYYYSFRGFSGRGHEGVREKEREREVQGDGMGDRGACYATFDNAPENVGSCLCSPAAITSRLRELIDTNSYLPES